MALSFEQTLIEVWRQALVENAKTVELGSERYPAVDRQVQRLALHLSPFVRHPVKRQYPANGGMEQGIVSTKIHA